MFCVLWVMTGASEDAIGKILNVAIKAAALNVIVSIYNFITAIEMTT